MNHNENGILQHPPISEPEPVTAPVVYTSCAVCGSASAGKCCQACWSARCRICGRVIWRDECFRDYGRGIRHTRCDGGRPVARPDWLVAR